MAESPRTSAVMVVRLYMVLSLTTFTSLVQGLPMICTTNSLTLNPEIMPTYSSDSSPPMPRTHDFECMDLIGSPNKNWSQSSFEGPPFPDRPFKSDRFYQSPFHSKSQSIEVSAPKSDKMPGLTHIESHE